MRRSFLLTTICIPVFVLQLHAQFINKVNVYSTTSPPQGHSLLAHDFYIPYPDWFQQYYDYSVPPHNAYPPYPAPLSTTPCYDYFPFTSPAQCLWSADTSIGSSFGLRHTFYLPPGQVLTDPVIVMTIDDDLVRNGFFVNGGFVSVGTQDRKNFHDTLIIVTIPKYLFKPGEDNAIAFHLMNIKCCGVTLRYHFQVEVESSGLPGCFAMDYHCPTLGDFHPLDMMGGILDLQPGWAPVQYMLPPPSSATGTFDYSGNATAHWEAFPLPLAMDRIISGINQPGWDEVTRVSICDESKYCTPLPPDSCSPIPCPPLPLGCDGWLPYVATDIEPVVGGDSTMSPEYGVYFEYIFGYVDGGIMRYDRYGAMAAVSPSIQGLDYLGVAPFQLMFDPQHPFSYITRPPIVNQIIPSQNGLPGMPTYDEYRICAKSDYSILYNPVTGKWDVTLGGDGKMIWANGTTHHFTIPSVQFSTSYPLMIDVRKGLITYQGAAYYKYVESGK